MTHGTGGTVQSRQWVEKQPDRPFRLAATPTNNTQVSYRFDAWSGTGAGSYSGTNNPASITMNGPITENASFIQNPVQVTVQTSPAGLTFSVDGTTYTSAQILFVAAWFKPHDCHDFAAVAVAQVFRYVWSNWSGGGAISHTVAPTTNRTYTATFRTQYYLTMTHGTGGTVSPASGWRGSGAAVSISATPTERLQLHELEWAAESGSYSGTNNPASITMSGPITETATFIHN